MGPQHFNLGSLLITTLTSEQKDLFGRNFGEQLVARLNKTSSIQTKFVSLAHEVMKENDLHMVLEVRPDEMKK